MLCAMVLGNVVVPQAPPAFGSRHVLPTAAVPTVPAPLHAATLAANNSVTVRIAYETTEVSTSPCNSQWNTCNISVASPACLQLYQSALTSVLACSSDPQYLTVSSSGTSLDFSYAVCVLLHS